MKPLNQSFNWQEAVSNTWNNNAAKWDERSRRMWEQGSRKDILPFIRPHFGKGTNVLDVGCGSGYGTVKLHEAGYHLTGVDISEEMIRLANQYRQQEDITFTQADVNGLPFADESFDGITSINVLEWTNIPVKALVELTRILKSDGLLCVGILGPTAGPRANSYRRVYGEDVILNTMMPWEFLQLAQEQGYELIDHRPVWKQEMGQIEHQSLPIKMQQALSFMWLFMLQKK